MYVCICDAYVDFYEKLPLTVVQKSQKFQIQAHAIFAPQLGVISRINRHIYSKNARKVLRIRCGGRLYFFFVGGWFLNGCKIYKSCWIANLAYIDFSVLR